MPKGIPLTEEEQARRRREIFQAAVSLFLDKGFNETSMREIAEAAGVGKSTLYDYFPSKDDILLSVFIEELESLTDKARQITSLPIGADEKLRQVIAAYLDYLSSNEEIYVKLSMEVQRLTQNSLERIQIMRHEYQDIVRAIIDDGIREGHFRKIDSLLAARVILSALSPAVYATRTNSPRIQMMEDAVSLVLNGLIA